MSFEDVGKCSLFGESDATHEPRQLIQLQKVERIKYVRMKVLDSKTVDTLSFPIKETLSSGSFSKSLTRPSVVLVSVTAYRARMACPHNWKTVSIPSSHLLNWRRWNLIFILSFSRLLSLLPLSFWLSISSLIHIMIGWNGINIKARTEYLLF